MISISESILSLIMGEANRHFPRETGGILLGQGLPPNKSLVTHIIGAGPLARHRKSTFEPDYQFQEAEITKIFLSTGGSCDYLGDWHSHPKGGPHPSHMDIQVLRRIREHGAARCERPVMCIVSGGPRWIASAWQLVEGSCLEIRIDVTPTETAHVGAN